MSSSLVAFRSFLRAFRSCASRFAAASFALASLLLFFGPLARLVLRALPPELAEQIQQPVPPRREQKVRAALPDDPRVDLPVVPRVPPELPVRGGLRLHPLAGDRVEPADLGDGALDAAGRALAEHDLAHRELLEVERVYARAPPQLVRGVQLEARRGVEDEQRQLLVPRAQRCHERRLPVDELRDVGVALARQQRLRQLPAVLEDGEVERRPPVRVLHVEVGAVLDQQVQALHSPLLGHRMRRRSSVGVLLVRIRALGQQRPHDGGLAQPRRLQEGARPYKLLPLQQVRIRVCQQLHRAHVAIRDRATHHVRQHEPSSPRPAGSVVEEDRQPRAVVLVGQERHAHPSVVDPVRVRTAFQKHLYALFVVGFAGYVERRLEVPDVRAPHVYLRAHLEQLLQVEGVAVFDAHRHWRQAALQRLRRLAQLQQQPDERGPAHFARLVQRALAAVVPDAHTRASAYQQIAHVHVIGLDCD
ncbi:iron-containing redox enzyme family protein [Babesia caballi]|uniref:Iron-containing redox enzyme family protein n=1 Tax=Babesia caballi TaxID=5871 RepID=A0AAV4LMB2_BABCB|nr:iron-containing redox enzyme family protein [Babesia caballi]